MRVALSVPLLFSGASPTRFPVVTSSALIAAVLVISYADLQRRHETNLLHNLGMPVMLIVAISALPAVVAESAIDIAQMLSR